MLPSTYVDSRELTPESAKRFFDSVMDTTHAALTALNKSSYLCFSEQKRFIVNETAQLALLAFEKLNEDDVEDSACMLLKFALCGEFDRKGPLGVMVYSAVSDAYRTRVPSTQLVHLINKLMDQNPQLRHREFKHGA